jgi:hypothetical protein
MLAAANLDPVARLMTFGLMGVQSNCKKTSVPPGQCLEELKMTIKLAYYDE